MKSSINEPIIANCANSPKTLRFSNSFEASIYFEVKEYVIINAVKKNLPIADMVTKFDWYLDLAL